MKCLVTGGNGFIGSHIVDRLLDSGHEVIVIDDLSAPQNSKFYYNPGAKYIKKDISIEDCADDFSGIDYVFHAAARSRIQPTIASPSQCFQTNVIGTQKVLEWSRSKGVKKVIYSSTSSLYGTQNQLPFSPNMPADCLNPYSLSKWMGELVCKMYSQLYGLDSIVLRYFNVYGPREPLKGHYAPVIGLFKRQHAAGVSMTIIGDGEQRRDFTYIDDVVSANISAMHSDVGSYEVYNVGTGKNYSINELASLIGGKNPSISNLKNRPAEVRETLADIKKTVNELGWKPRFSLEQKIKSY